MIDASLADRVRQGDVRAVARAISLVEDEAPGVGAWLGRLGAGTSRTFVLGVTGPPGAGKSTLVDRLVTAYRAAGRQVAVLAVDPSSPYSGGAILGDRVRMQAHAVDPGVFIRSMATRGHLGGLARATADARLIVEAAGFDLVIIETVGVGQAEVDIVRTADVCLVLAVPGAGDDVQALKAGIMEIADVFVLNKADQPGADRAAAAIEAAVALDQRPAEAWRPAVVPVVATTGTGLEDLIAAIERCRARTGGIDDRRRQRAEVRLREMVASHALALVEAQTRAGGEWARSVEQVAAGRVDPYAHAAALVARAAAGEVGPVDHVGLATGSIADALAVFGGVLGAPAGPVEEMPAHEVRAQFIGTGPASIELIEPTAATSPVATFLRRRGPGLHHLALRVADLEGTLAALKARGLRLIDETGRPGARGARVAFVHPASTGGVLIELVAREGVDGADR